MKTTLFPKLIIDPPNDLKQDRNNDDVPACRAPDPQLVPVHFEFKDPKATTVCLAGTFNHWQPDSKTLDSSGVGHWWKDTALEPGAYEYCFVVDGNWIPDPLVRETVPNPFGGRNSLLRVANSPEAAHRADAENLPLENEYKQ
jgi:1,4-alpha-glucan branching enzyme